MTDWQNYLAGFHARSPGISEDVLTRTSADGLTPYDWLARAIAPEVGRVLDLAAGSGAMARVLADAVPGRPTKVVSLDQSEAELRRAAREQRSGWLVQGRAERLPFRDEAFDAVTCSMGPMVFERYQPVLAEAARVLRPGGVIAATASTAIPLRSSDITLLTKVTARLRALPQFPAGTELTGLREALADAGFRMLEDARERFCFTVRAGSNARNDADLLLRALYLPGTPDRRRSNAAAWLAERAEQSESGVEIAIPIRRVVAARKEQG
jgi:SAM-dependent methyltransferase